jgi:nitrous oxidase accessory protein
MKILRAIGVPLLVSLLVLAPASSCLALLRTCDCPQSHLITVDDDGDGDYTSIKDAVNNASPGDTIEVYSGTYFENNITISKPYLTLLGIPHELGNGSGTGKPFINGQGLDDVINIFADNTILSGFHIENSGNRLVSALLLSNNCKYCIVSDNDISNNSCGMLIACGSCHNCTIINNTLRRCVDYQGIVVTEPSSYNTITGNTITDVSLGVDLWESSHNTVTKNTIRKCLHGIDVSSDGNSVSLNTLENNTLGIIVTGYGNEVRHNNLINNQQQATFIIPPDMWHGPGYIKWVGNYWNRPQRLPHLIFGYTCLVPWFNVDWRPALAPYDIS